MPTMHARLLAGGLSLVQKSCALVSISFFSRTQMSGACG